MLKIWGRKNSSNVRKALWCAEELGLAYEAIDAGGAFGVVDTPEYRAKNPKARIRLINWDPPMTHYGHVELPRQLASATFSVVRWFLNDERGN